MLLHRQSSLVLPYMGNSLRKGLFGHASSEDSDQTAHSRSLIRILAGQILDRQGCKSLFMLTTKTDQIAWIRRLVSVFTGKTLQEGGTFSHVGAHMSVPATKMFAR